MVVKREDLLAAASVGVLQYGQVEPVLVFLLQRDVQLHRHEMLIRKGRPRLSARQLLLYLVALIGLAMVAMVLGMYSRLVFDALGMTGLLAFTAAYAVFTIATAAWFERSRMAVSARFLATSLIALLPLAVFAAQLLYN